MFVNVNVFDIYVIEIWSEVDKRMKLEKEETFAIAEYRN